MIETFYAVPGAIALIEWLLATLFYAFSWYQARDAFRRWGDGLVLAGWITSLATVAWLAWSVSPDMVLARSSLAMGLGAAVVAVYGALAHERTERVSAILILGLAIPAQAYAVGRMWRGVEVMPQAVFMPTWAVLRTVIGFVGYGALGVAIVVTLLAFVFARARARLPGDQLPVIARLMALEWRSVRIALVALSVSLAVELVRSWWGMGQVMVDGFGWLLITWLLLVAAAYGFMQGAIPRRFVRVLLVLAAMAAGIAALAIAG